MTKLINWTQKSKVGKSWPKLNPCVSFIFKLNPIFNPICNPNLNPKPIFNLKPTKKIGHEPIQTFFCFWIFLSPFMGIFITFYGHIYYLGTWPMFFWPKKKPDDEIINIILYALVWLVKRAIALDTRLCHASPLKILAKNISWDKWLLATFA